MAKQNWYPQTTGNAGTDETNRIAFDSLYQLRDRMDGIEKNGSVAKGETSSGAPSFTLYFSPGTGGASLTINGKSVTKLTFVNGRLTAWK